MRSAAIGLALLAGRCGGDATSAPTGPLVGARLAVEAPDDAPEAAKAPDAPAPRAPEPAAVESVPALPPAPPPPAPAPGTGPAVALDFAQLAAWDVPRIRLPSALPPVPEALQALHGRRVCIAGYVVPDRMREGHRIATALFIKHLAACCFGTIPVLNEWVHLQVDPDAGIDFNLRRPARVEGTFLIGPHATGEVSHALYRIVVTRITEDEEYDG